MYEDCKEVISERIADLTEAEKEEKVRIVVREVAQEKNAALTKKSVAYKTSPVIQVVTENVVPANKKSAKVAVVSCPSKSGLDTGLEMKNSLEKSLV